MTERERKRRKILRWLQATKRHRDEHAPHVIAARLARNPNHSYLKDYIYGATDGAVTTFAVVAGATGAELPARVVIVLGVANLVADGFSMAVSNFLGVRAERQRLEQLRAEELRHIRLFPEGEVEEIRQIYARKGFSGEALEHVVRVITGNQSQWVDTMLQDEHGVGLESPSPWRAALTTFLAFVMVGAIPLLAYLTNWLWPGTVGRPFDVSLGLTACAFFIVGAGKSRFVAQSWHFAGLETLLVGAFASGLAYAAGHFLEAVAE